MIVLQGCMIIEVALLWFPDFLSMSDLLSQVSLLILVLLVCKSSLSNFHNLFLPSIHMVKKLVKIIQLWSKFKLSVYSLLWFPEFLPVSDLMSLSFIVKYYWWWYQNVLSYTWDFHRHCWNNLLIDYIMIRPQLLQNSLAVWSLACGRRLLWTTGQYWSIIDFEGRPLWATRSSCNCDWGIFENWRDI
jgi:hypothetical protein